MLIAGGGIAGLTLANALVCACYALLTLSSADATFHREVEWTLSCWNAETRLLPKSARPLECCRMGAV